MRKFERILLYAVAVSVLGLSAAYMCSSLAKPKVAFVDIGKMLEGYQFKKKLELASGNGLSQIKQVIDSLQMVRKIGAGTPRLDTQIASAQYAFRQYYDQSNHEVTKKVWERLNPLMEQYGREHGLQLLIGATGTGNVLYGSDVCDVTNDLVRFINNHFEKGS